MNFKNISKTKLSLAVISIIITFILWQQGLRDSLNRPSVSFDISQKEKEITELAVQSMPMNFKKFFITNNPVEEINNELSSVSFNQLTERNQIIQIISSDASENRMANILSLELENKNYKLIIDEIKERSKNNTNLISINLMSLKGIDFYIIF